MSFNNKVVLRLGGEDDDGEGDDGGEDDMPFFKECAEMRAARQLSVKEKALRLGVPDHTAERVATLIANLDHQQQEMQSTFGQVEDICKLLAVPVTALFDAWNNVFLNGDASSEKRAPAPPPPSPPIRGDVEWSNVRVVSLQRDGSKGWGMRIITRTIPNGSLIAVIKEIAPDSPAAINPLMSAGSAILSINNVAVEDMTHENLVLFLQAQSTITMCIAQADIAFELSRMCISDSENHVPNTPYCMFVPLN